MFSREVIGEMLAKYDSKKKEIEERYKKDKKEALIKAIIGVVLIIVGCFFQEYIWMFLIAAAILFYKAYDCANLGRFSYQYHLEEVWKEFSTTDFVKLIVHSLENGESDNVVQDATFNELNMGRLNLTSGVISCDFKDERVNVANFYAYHIKTDRKGESYESTDFDGVAVIKSIRKKVDTEVIITPEYFSALTDYKKVSMDNSKFNKNYEVYAEENKDAFIALTPEVMEYLLDLSNKFKITAVLIKNNNLYVFINNKKMIFDIQDEKLRMIKGYKKALDYMTVDFTIQNLAKFHENYFNIVEAVDKINI